MKLSQTRANKITKPGRYGDGHGLYLQVTKEGNRSWVFRFERDGHERWMGLGPLRDVTLEDARDKARAARKLLWDGIDPITVTNEQRAQKAKAFAGAKTFRQAADAFFDANHIKWNSKRYQLAFHQRMEAHAFPKLGSLPVAAIDKPIIIDALKPIWNSKHATAVRVLGLIENVLDFANVSGWRSGDNPAKWRGNLEHVMPALDNRTKHHEALPFDEIYDFMTKLSAIKSVAARAVEFTILTAVRTGEARFATWDEINFDTQRWTIPAERTKTRKPHVVPLAPRAIELLKALPREHGTPYVFIGIKIGQPLGHTAFQETTKRINPEITMHGFRSCFRDWAGERTSFANHIVEMALAHAIGSAVEKAYRRRDLFDQRVPLMNEWARYCYTAPTKGATITLIRSARK
jgi:integrase